MKKQAPASNPDAFVAALKDWRRERVESLREAARSAKGLAESIKWGNLFYESNGPVLMIRAEASRVLFGFWRGQRLMSVEPRLKAGGAYEMATLELREGTAIAPAIARRLVREAVALNAKLGNPQFAAKQPPAKGAARRSRPAAKPSRARAAKTRR